MALSIRMIGPGFAAEARGLDLRQPLSEARFAELRAALHEHGVLLLPGQDVTHEQHAAFTARFGAPDRTRLRKTARGRLPEGFADISNIDADNKSFDETSDSARFSKANQLWHADLSYKPHGGGVSILVAKEIASEAGETEWADMRQAYDALDDKTRAFVESHVALHSILYSRAKAGFTGFTEEERRMHAPVRQPLARVHPVTGRKMLLIGSHADFIEGMEDGEGRKILSDLLEFATQKRFVYTHRWAVNDMVLWDNQSVLHRGRPWNMNERRVMQRTMTIGEWPGLDQEQAA